MKLRFFIIIQLFLPFSVCGQDSLVFNGNQKDLYDFSIDEMLKIKVSTAGKAEENIEDAAGILSVVTEKEIENYGANNILEVIERICSIYTLGSALLPNNMISIRGDLSVHYNNRVLLLLNGRPIRESITGGIKMAFNSLFPVNRIARIEVIRGPGSVLYGSGAYTGVINVITKTTQNQSIEANFKMGSFARIQGSVVAQKKIKAFEAGIGINLVDDKGWDFTANDGSDPSVKRTISMKDQGIGINIDASFKGLKLNAIYASNKQRAMYFPLQWSVADKIRSNDTLKNQPYNYVAQNTLLFADIGYELPITKTWRATFNITSNNNYFNEQAESAIDDIARSKSNDVLAEMTHFVSFSKKANLIIGGLFNHQTGSQLFSISTKVPKSNSNTLGLGGYGSYNIFNYNQGKNPDPYAIIPYYAENLYAAYTQADYSPTKKIKFVVGGQFNAVPNQKLDFVPRMAFLYKPNEDITFKVLYGQAFRAASANERFVRVNFVYGNQNLRPEKISTFETGIFIKNRDNSVGFNLVYFNSMQQNLISRANVKLENGQFQTQYINLGIKRSQGIEIEGYYKLMNGFTIQSAVSIISTVDQLRTTSSISGNDTSFTRNNFMSTPNAMAKIGLIYNFKKIFTLGIFNNFYSGAVVYAAGTNNQLAKPINPEINTVNVISANLQLKLGSLIASNFLKRLTLSAYFTNILDEKIMMPDVQQTVNTLPGKGGRAFYGSLNYGF